MRGGAVLLLVAGLIAQEDARPVTPPPQDPGARDPSRSGEADKTVRAIDFEPPIDNAASITRFLRTKVGQPLQEALVQEDIRDLWQMRQIRARVWVEDADGGVRVIFEIEEQRAFDRIEFRGLDELTEREVRLFLGISPGQRINRVAAEKFRLRLQDRYQRLGYAFIDVRIVEDLERSLLTLYVDEGPKVTVGAVHIRGNRAFPYKAFLGLMENLRGGAGMKSVEGVLTDGPYSEDLVEEDLDRLRFFYRKQGYRDALVELASVVFDRHREKVELTIRIVEGQRYKIASVDVERVLPSMQIDPDPLYPKEEILARLNLRAGEYFDQALVDLDRNAIEEFYGERGHPSDTLGTIDGFQMPDPVEVFDPQKGEIALIYRVIEGSPKTLRDVVIRGNTETKDEVIRRKVFLFPGDGVDTTKIRRSLRALNALRYFQDLNDPTGVTYELLPVDGEPGKLDLALDLQEGDTGQFLWGAGVSTAAGVQARFVFTKRNADITRLPTSWNPLEIFREIAAGQAFHGAGQNVELMLAPGTEISLFQLSFFDPDIFRRHFDTIGMRVNGFRRLQYLDSFRMDALGAGLSLSRAFTEEFEVGVSLRQEHVEVRDIDANAPTIVYDAEGGTELRGVGAHATLRDVDDPFQPTDGYQLRLSGEVVGGPFGGDADFFKLGTSYQLSTPLYRDSLDRAHVFYFSGRFDYGEAFGDSEDLFLTERFYMGGNTLRGFDQRKAGPSQFGQPLGGEARYLTTLEYQFPLVSTRRERSLRETEMLRGVVFTDFGLLGLGLDDVDFGRPRLSVGFGLRIFVPVFEVPIALDLGWPILDEATDSQQHFYFSLSHF